MMQQPRPDDLVIATRQKYPVRTLRANARSYLGLRVGWRRAVLNETGLQTAFMQADLRYSQLMDAGSPFCVDPKVRSDLDSRRQISFAEMVTTDVARGERDMIVDDERKISRPYD